MRNSQLKTNAANELSIGHNAQSTCAQYGKITHLQIPLGTTATQLADLIETTRHL